MVIHVLFPVTTPSKSQETAIKPPPGVCPVFCTRLSSAYIATARPTSRRALRPDRRPGGEVGGGDGGSTILRQSGGKRRCH